MNRIVQITILILVLILTFTSCKKEELPRPNNAHYVDDTEYTVEGITWVLAEGKFYRDNLTTGDVEVFDHFSSNRKASSMGMFGSGPVIMDSIFVDYTTWFFSDGTFTLNGGGTYDYTVYDNRVWSPIGLEGGTSRPIEVQDIDEDRMTVIVHEAYGSDNVDNYKFWSVLTFIKAGTSCNSCGPEVTYGYTYKGVWEAPTLIDPTSIVGSKWVVTRYNNGLSGNVYPNDTLDFVSQTNYTINSGVDKSYTLSNVVGNNNKSLSLYSFTTLGGDYSGQVITSFLDDGIINNSQFTDMFNVNNTVTVWMERIQ